MPRFRLGLYKVSSSLEDVGGERAQTPDVHRGGVALGLHRAPPRADRVLLAFPEKKEECVR